MTDQDQPLPPAAAMVSHPVADFDTWRAGFDAQKNEDDRRGAGVLGHHLNRSEDDPNLVSIYLAVSDVDRARAFTASDALRSAMQEVGVTGPPEIAWMTPVREEIIWDRELPAVVVRHEVSDFDRWLEGYDAAGELRESKGIIGHAVNRSLDDPSVVVVYHQAESFKALRAFLDDPVLQTAMQEAGVSSEPEVSFHTGGWAKLYE